jgi:hypothetical protein
MKGYQVFVLCAVFTTALCETLEWTCVQNVTYLITLPKQFALHRQIQNNELNKLNNYANMEEFKNACEEVHRKVVALQEEIARDTKQCNDDKANAENEDLIKMSNKLAAFMCNLNEENLRNLNDFTRFERMIESHEAELKNCLKLSEIGTQTRGVLDFCLFNSTTFISCSENFLSDSSTGFLDMVKNFWKLTKATISCGENGVAKTPPNYVENYVQHWLYPVFKGREEVDRSGDNDVNIH